MLETVLHYIENFRDRENLSTNVTNEQLDALDKRREKYIAGEGKSYSWEEVKKELIDKHGLQS